MREIVVSVDTEYIRLDDLLKLVNEVSSGGEAKLRIQGGEVSVNGEICTQRGRKLRTGDRVSMEGLLIQLQEKRRLS